MTPSEALSQLDALRKGVLTVQNGTQPRPLSGAEHDTLRDAIETLRAAITPPKP